MFNVFTDNEYNNMQTLKLVDKHKGMFLIYDDTHHYL
jgi:hypothetical protein